MDVASQNSTLPSAITGFPVRCFSVLLEMSSRFYLFFLPRGHDLRPPSVTVSTCTSAFNAVAFQSPTMPNARMSLWTQSVHSFFFPPRPLRTAPSRFHMYPNTYICKQMRTAVHVYLPRMDASARTLHFPVQLTTSRFGNLTRLIHTLL